MVEPVVRSRGGIASTRTLVGAGVTRSRIDAAVRNGELIRIHRGWYRTHDAHPDVVTAIQAGGTLTCISALRFQGVWTMPEQTLHVRIGRGSALKLLPDLRIHWSDRRPGFGFPVDSITAALECAVRCLDRRAAVVALDSAQNLRMVSRAQAQHACDSPRGKALLALSDPSCESGTETLARLALRRLRIRHRTQVPISGVGRVDFVIGDRLVLEVDGEAWHNRPDQFEKDRARDRELAARGYLPIRASYLQVMNEWPVIERQVLAIVRRDRHLWPRRRA